MAQGIRYLICDCEKTMSLDGAAIAKGCGAGDGLDVNTHLCRSQIDNFKAAAAAEGRLIVACTQEAPLFRETLEEMAAPAAVSFVNIRERAGWSDDARNATAKIAALLAEATIDVPPARSVALTSEGTCLIYATDERAIALAGRLAARLEVTVLLTGGDEVIPPRAMSVPVFKGTIVAATGHLGAFEITVDGYASYKVSARGALVFDRARDGVRSGCDLMVDLTGGAPLFPGPEKRDGYFRPDPGDPAAVERALFDAADMVGEFEKPRYVEYDANLCTHSRSGITGCTRCLDACPASAITPLGDVVAIDPFVCGGCGACNSVCPTGAMGYAMPPTATLLERARVLLRTYASAGGARPVLLVHDERRGEELIHMSARFGAGLPANVIPFAVREVTQIGLDFLLGALALGAGGIAILIPPERRDEQDGLSQQTALADAIMDGLAHGADRVRLLEIDDPDALEAALGEPPAIDGIAGGDFLPLGNKRGLMRLALAQLRAASPAAVDLLALPPDAPFGTVDVDVEGCTLCLACVAACPTGALQDDPDAPMLRFQEEACVQCGLCRNTCPEKVITLTPRLNFTETARRPILIKEEEPFECVRCGTPFGTKSSIERIVATLAEKHSMFADKSRTDLIRMCADCRVIAQSEMPNSPFAMGERPRTRTTEDYLRAEQAELDAARARAVGTGDGSGDGDG